VALGLLLGYLALWLLSLVAAVLVVVSLPPRHFVDDPAADPRAWFRRTIAAAARNALGLLLVVMGLVLSVPGVPGQGMLTLFVGTLLLDFPGRRQLTRWLVTRRGILDTMNRLRGWFRRPPLILNPPAGEDPAGLPPWSERADQDSVTSCATRRPPPTPRGEG
jgi:hypothetical protein